ncbi:aminotransferase class I/II-fold pyridoxal phosphate-dependent enzyme [bacterium]|nr:aminotransferase class I/II-fold pyridoxal phosphate-dependent enzyme [candidate division CSSED10-310 bacterium]
MNGKKARVAIPRRQVVVHEGMLDDLVRYCVQGNRDDADIIGEFERRFARFVGVAHAVAVSSGRQGLRAIVRALGLTRGSRILVPAYTYRAVVQALRAEGMVPVFVDIRAMDHNMDLAAVDAAASDAQAVIATHIFGNPLEMDRLLAIAGRNGLVVIEDCAHALGATSGDRQVGSFGRASFFSFGATKLFNTFGGGMVATSDAELAARLREQALDLPPMKTGPLASKALVFMLLAAVTRPRAFSWTLYPVLLLSDSLQMDVIELYERLAKPAAEVGLIETGFHPLQARWGIQGLLRLDADLARRRQVYQDLDARLEPRIERLRPAAGGCRAPYFYIVMHPERNALKRFLLKAGIDTGNLVMDNCPHMFGMEGAYPMTVRARMESVQIPVFPWFTDREIDRIAGCLNGFFEKLQ